MAATSTLEWYSKVANRTDQEIADSLKGILNAKNASECHESDAKSKFSVVITVKRSEAFEDE